MKQIFRLDGNGILSLSMEWFRDSGLSKVIVTDESGKTLYECPSDAPLTIAKYETNYGETRVYRILGVKDGVSIYIDEIIIDLPLYVPSKADEVQPLNQEESAPAAVEEEKEPAVDMKRHQEELKIHIKELIDNVLKA